MYSLANIFWTPYMKSIALHFLSMLAVISCSSPKQESTSTLKPILIQSPARTSAAEPFLYNNNSITYLSWVEETDSTATLLVSKLDNDKWSQPTKIATGNSWFVNWADYPMIASNGETQIAHFLDRSADGKYTYDVKLTLSNDGGATWSNPIKLNDDGKDAEHGFVSMQPFGDNFFVSWLDGRNTVMPEGHEGMNHGMHHGAMTLRAAIIDRNGKKINEWELDDKTCDCCQTTAAITPNGPVVIYRDRSDDEIRDMSIVRLVDNQWTSPKSIHNDNWNMPGCPVNGPRSDSKDNTLVVAWYSAASDSSRVNVIFSDDSGASFGNVIPINESLTVGRVDVALLDNNTALVTWIEDRQIKMARVSKDGTRSQSLIVANTSDARSSGFPQLAISHDHAIIAWTDDKENTIKTSMIPLYK